MLIYLDSKDIISLFEKSKPVSTEKFNSILLKGNHRLVLSIVTVLEVSAPLLHKNASSNISRLLNQIEKLPHTFIHSSKITLLELKEAISAFLSSTEYKNPTVPFVDRFDTIIDLNGNPSTMRYLNYPLSEVVWDLYSVGALKGFKKRPSNALETAIAADRALDRKPNLKDNFAATFERHIKNYSIEMPSDGIKDLASWVYSTPKRCPSIRIGYELFHKITKNVDDLPNHSDLGDIHNINCLPYVDAMTVDRRMHGYISQVGTDLKMDFSKKVFRNIMELLDIIVEN